MNDYFWMETADGYFLQASVGLDLHCDNSNQNQTLSPGQSKSYTLCPYISGTSVQPGGLVVFYPPDGSGDAIFWLAAIP